MSVRSRRRMGLRPLEQMTDSELQEVRYFGNLAAAPDTLTYVATMAEQEEAATILQTRKERHA